MKCLDCGGDISDVPSDARGLIVCPSCQLQYANELIEGSDPAAWERVRESRKFRRHGNQLWFFTNELMTK